MTVTAQNTGNVNANVTVTDTIPPEAKLISGETSFSQVLASGGGLKTITYIMQMNKEGEIKLPACKASFIDLDEIFRRGQFGHSCCLCRNSDFPGRKQHAAGRSIRESTEKNESTRRKMNPSSMVQVQVGGRKRILEIFLDLASSLLLQDFWRFIGLLRKEKSLKNL